MNLINAYQHEGSIKELYELLKMRSATHSISHNKMPEYAEHELFFKSKPYRHWYLVRQCNKTIGSVYITENNEIGLFIPEPFTHLQSEVLRIVIASNEPLPAVKSKRVAQFSINSNPENAQLISAITSAGGVHVQNTYLLTQPND